MRVLKLAISNSRASYYTGGTEIVSLHQAVGLARRGHIITYFVRKTKNYSEHFNEFKRTIDEESLPISIRVVSADASFGNGHSWEVWNQEAHAFGNAAQHAYQETIKNGTDLFIAHMTTDSLYLPESIPQVVHLHGSPTATDPLINKSMTRPKFGIAHSKSIRTWWSEHFPSIPMQTYHNGVHTEIFDCSPESYRPTDILYVGRFLEHKGILDILEAATPKQKVVIAGSGILHDKIQEIVNIRNLDVDIIINPSNKEVVDLYKQSKIFTCPSRAKEGVLTTMLEAGAAGCAVITTTGSGMTDLAQNNKNSCLVSPGDIASLKVVLQELLNDRARRIRIARSLQHTIQSKWSWETKAKELEAIYEKICNHPKQ